MSDAEKETLRLDVWLWRARFFRTRALATAHVSSKGIRMTRNGQTRRIDKPGTRVGEGDIIVFKRGREITMVEIVDIGLRRGPASEAQALYTTHTQAT